MRKKISEIEVAIHADDKMRATYDKIKDKLKDDDTINLLNPNTNESSSPLSNKITVDSLLNTIGVDLNKLSPESKGIVIDSLMKVISTLEGVGAINKTVDRSEIDSLYSGSDDRGVEYGVRYEGFQRVLEKLKKGGAPRIKITENINPRIKKMDLINYLKNKNNVK